MHVSLPKALQEYVEKRYRTGRYSTKSEIVHEGLRRLMDDEEQQQQKLEALKNAIKEGLESGEPVDGEEVFAELRGRVEKHRQAK